MNIIYSNPLFVKPCKIRKAEKMDEKMKKALLDCCERNCKVISPDVVAFAKDLVNTAILTSENKIDDMFTPIINKGIEVLDEYLLKQIDKIDGATA